MGKIEKKNPLGRPKRRWKYNITIYLKDIDYDGVNWMHLTHDRNM